MNTSKIGVLCSKSDRIFENEKKAESLLSNMKNVSSISITSSFCSNLVVKFDDYPELKPLAEKLLKYLVKSEEAKQNEIKVEIAKCL